MKKLISYLSITLLSVLTIVAQKAQEDVIFTYDKQTTYVDVYAENTTFATMSVYLDADMINMKLSPEEPIKAVLKPKEKKKIGRMEVITRNQKWNYNLQLAYVQGNILHFAYNREYKYRFPYKTGDQYPILQSCRTQFTHNGQQNYAIDFDMPEGTPIYSARSGRVTTVKTNSNKNGITEDYIKYTNYIRIEHDDFTIADYSHIKYNGAVVKPNEWVEKGQLIGYSGNTGMSTQPHLHFAIIVPNPNFDLQTLPILWIDKDSNIIECPKEGNLHIAGE